MYEYKWEYHYEETWPSVYKWCLFFNGYCFGSVIDEESAKEICEDHNRKFESVSQ